MTVNNNLLCDSPAKSDTHLAPSDYSVHLWVYFSVLFVLLLDFTYEMIDCLSFSDFCHVA